MTLATNTLTDAELLRYARQIFLPQWEDTAQLKLKQAHVLLIGCGGLGGIAANLLYRAGLGRLTLVDGDQVDGSNLQRQALFWPEDIGQNKAQVLAQRLAGLSNWQSICALDHMAEVSWLPDWLSAHRPDLILDCTDQFAIRDLINRLAVQQRIPLLSAAAIGYSGQLMMIRPGTACYACVFGGQVADDRRCADSGVLATTPNLMGNWQAHLALRWLGQGIDELDGRLLLWEGVDTRLIRIKPDPACPICQPTCADALIKENANL